jgi:hypothetical protein
VQAILEAWVADLNGQLQHHCQVFVDIHVSVAESCPVAAHTLECGLQAILEAWVADLNGQPQQRAELEEHMKVAEAQMQGVEQLLFRVAALARNQQPDAPAVTTQAAKRTRGQ